MTTHDEWLKIWKASEIANACLIRVTNQCDQKCKHCSSRSGPECIGQMTVDMCEKINIWTPCGVFFNVMGGEFSVLDNYPELLLALVKNKRHIRLVTNGFWAHQDPDKFLDTLKKIKNETTCQKIEITVSSDIFHRPEQSKHAITLLMDNKDWLMTDTTVGFDTKDVSPIGRAWDNNICPMDTVKCDCHNMCNMTIIENGMVCICPFGYFPWKHFEQTTWEEAQEYIWSWRAEQLVKETTCDTCMKIDASDRR